MMERTMGKQYLLSEYDKDENFVMSVKAQHKFQKVPSMDSICFPFCISERYSLFNLCFLIKTSYISKIHQILPGHEYKSLYSCSAFRKPSTSTDASLVAPQGGNKFQIIVSARLL